MKKNVHAENDLIQKEKVSLDSGDKGGKIKTFMSTAGQKTQELLQGIVEKTEQNGDGKVVLENAAALVNSARTAAKRMLSGAAELADEASRQYELKKLNPLFESELYKDSETLPRFVRIIPREKRYAESELCTGAVGYRSTYSKQELVNIFQDSVEGLGLHLYPSLDEEFYFVDPTEPNRYLALSKYFDYLKDARINELQKIAQDWGQSISGLHTRRKRPHCLTGMSKQRLSSRNFPMLKTITTGNKSSMPPQELQLKWTFRDIRPSSRS